MQTRATKKKTTRPTRRKPPLRRALPQASEMGKHPSGELVVVFVSNGPYAAEIAKGKLESQGIEGMLQSEAQSTFPLTVDELGEVKVLVRPEDAKRARRILGQSSRKKVKE